MPRHFERIDHLGASEGPTLVHLPPWWRRNVERLDEFLKDQVDTTDETGADIREYTGEPVDTGDGIVIPQQQNVGEERVVGGGEFHDR